jgi:hypothetical protein
VTYIPMSSLLRFNFFSQPTKKKKILLKQSYLFLTWFFYLNKVKQKNKICVVALPSRRIVFTTTKAPMAHRKNSKEQYKLQYYNFYVKFQLTSFLLDENEMLYLLLFYKKNFVFFETNLFLLKNFNILLTSTLFSFLNFFKFLQLNKTYLR